MAIADTSENDSPIMKARGLTVMHQIGAAEAIYRQILQVEPDTPEALNFVAMCELGRGEFSAALERLQRALKLEPEEPDLWKNLGIALLAVGRAQDAIDAFDRVLSMEPKTLPARLHRAAAFERLGNVYDATAAYDCVLTMAQKDGRWRSDKTTPAELQPVVRHAMRYVNRHRRQLLLDLLQPVRARYGAASLARVEQGLAIYLGEQPSEYVDVRQSCSFFHVPGLAGGPLLAAEALPGVARLVQQRATLRDELGAAIAGKLGVEPYFGTHDMDFLRRSGALDGAAGARLSAFFLYRRGAPERFGQMCCPRSTTAVDVLPQPVRVPGLGPDVFFAILAPGTHVLKSNGITNARISVEIPLQVAGDCVRTVAGSKQAWREGGCVAYDPSFEHELCNTAAGTSTALVLDAWHPDLSAAERAALTLLFNGISDYNRAANVEPAF